MFCFGKSPVQCTRQSGQKSSAAYVISQSANMRRGFEGKWTAFRSLYENTKIGLYRTTPDGKYFSKSGISKMLGYKSFQDLADKTWNKTALNLPINEKNSWKIEKDGEVNNLESKWTRQDGTPVLVIENARAIRDSQNKTLSYDGTVEDITDRKRTEKLWQKNANFLQALMDNIPDGIYFKDMEAVLFKSTRLRPVILV